MAMITIVEMTVASISIYTDFSNVLYKPNVDHSPGQMENLNYFPENVAKGFWFDEEFVIRMPSCVLHLSISGETFVGVS